MLLIVVIGIVIQFHLEFIIAENKSIDSIVYEYPVAAWISKPPYAELPTNDSFRNNVPGMIQDVVLSHMYIWPKCSLNRNISTGSIHVIKHVKTQRVASEFAMIELLRQNKVQMAFPIFEPPTNRLYSDFYFFKLCDYPGSEFITTEDKTKALNVVLDEVMKSWPLLVVTLVLTAIAGVIMWSLDTYWNSEQFSRSFIKGSWDGLWWSFISMTTVGYGDKSPKSIVARIFSIIWIMLGLIVMAMFTANVSSALTVHTIGQTSLLGLKFTQQNPTKNVSLFGYSSPFVKQFLYISLGVLGGLLLIGTVWEIVFRRKLKTKDNVALARVVTYKHDAIRNDLEETRKLLRDMQYHFDKLEAEVLSSQDNNEIVCEEGWILIDKSRQCSHCAISILNP